MPDREELQTAYLQACEIELQAFKPGNVSIYSPAHDMTVDDFRISAAVSAAPLTNPDFSLGEKIYHAIKATREAVACNTNLGIVLLAAPLLQAATTRTEGQSLRTALAQVLNNTTREDADWVFKAICLAAPAGLGTSAEQDVNTKAEVTLTEAMAIAGDKDRIAKQFTDCFKDIFDFTVLEYNRAFVLSGDSSRAALTVFCEMLARFPDSHIERKYGKQYSEWIKTEMSSLANDLSDTLVFETVLPRLYKLDRTFKSKKINPGTTADLTVATVLVVIVEQLIGTLCAVE